MMGEKVSILERRAKGTDCGEMEDRLKGSYEDEKSVGIDFFF